MNIKPIIILAACAFCTAGCNKSPTTPTANNNGSQPPPALIQPEPFHGQVYKPIDGSDSLTLVSKDECEISTGGSIVLCKYTKPNDTLRVVTPNSQVLYFRITDQGLVEGNGNIWYDQERYEAIIRKQLAEKKRAEEEMAKSIVETRTLATFPLQVVSDGYANQITISDVSLHLHIPNRRDDDETKNGVKITYFANIEKISKVQWNNSIAVTSRLPENVKLTEILKPSQNNLESVYDSIMNAYNNWKIKFPR